MIPPRVRALFLLALATLRTLLWRLGGASRSGVGIFRENYDADGLPPVTSSERQASLAFGRCISCGLCDRGEAERIRESGGAYRGVMSLMVAASRSMPDFRAAAYSFSFVPEAVLAEKERICPTHVPMRKIAEFVKQKADAVGGAWPLPPRVNSLRPATYENAQVDPEAKT